MERSYRVTVRQISSVALRPTSQGNEAFTVFALVTSQGSMHRVEWIFHDAEDFLQHPALRHRVLSSTPRTGPAFLISLLDLLKDNFSVPGPVTIHCLCVSVVLSHLLI